VRLSPLSTTIANSTSYGGTRDVSLDLSDYLESGETISTVNTSVSDDDLVVISNGTISSQNYNFTVSAYPTKVEGMATITLEVTGSAGSQDVFVIEQPLQKSMRT